MSTTRHEPNAVPDVFLIAEHLLAHARLCRHIAEQSWSEETARELDALAGACVRAAAEMMQVKSDATQH